MSSTTAIQLLVVDDEPDLCTLYELTLVREGYAVETAATVEDAWHRLLGKKYDALITDLRLPDGTGLDLIRRLEAEGRREKAIVITAYGSAENAVEALKAGAYDYLTKPVDLRQFRSIVASAVGRTAAAPAVSGSAGAPPARSTGQDSEGVVRSPSATRGADVRAVEESPKSMPSAIRLDDRRSRQRAGSAAGEGVSATLARMVGDSGALSTVRTLIAKVARSMAPALIHGESGTGKELVARSVHEVSSRAARPFVAVNCGAIPEHLLEAEFFGYRKGAFTGAIEDREGFFQAAASGTLFLDEIGDLPLAMQSKLLRVIQERAVRPVGATAEVPVDVRIISATHKDLAREVQAGRFRQDLYYRLNVIQIQVPPLRERVEDLPKICESLLQRIAREADADPLTLSPAALSRLQRYAFPGNVRELENLLHRAVALANALEIFPEDLGLPDDVLAEASAAAMAPVPQLETAAPGPEAVADGAPAPSLPDDLAVYLDNVERDLLQRALRVHRYNRTAAGAAMGLSLRQMRYRMARLGVQGAEDASGKDDD